MLTTDNIKFAQHLLALKGLYRDEIDGFAGPKTLAALNAVSGLPKSWSLEKKLVGLIQLEAKAKGFDPRGIDGYWGPDTDIAFEQLRSKILFGTTPAPWRPEEIISPVNPNNWPLDNPAALETFFGKKATNLTSLELPYPMKLSFPPFTEVKKITCHKLVKDSLHRVLSRVKATYGTGEISRLRLDVFGGCFNDRPIRGGTRPSTHAWGIALDFDPDNNQLRWGRDRASFARPEYVRWWEIWEAEGWVSLGRARNFDWMHVQAAKVET